MNVLFLCVDMDGLHGSFLHVMEYAEYFKSNGWDVTIGSIYISDFNRQLAESKGFQVSSINGLPNLEYDLVYALHLLLFPALVCRGLRYKKAIAMSLSSFVPIEQLPPKRFLSQFDLIGALSQEAVDNSSRKFGIKPSLYKIIPNHIPLAFLEKSRDKKTWNDRVANVCVISNHYINEVAGIRNVAGFNVDYYGKDYNNPKYITPGLLLKYDVIITIGKTVQYGLGLGIPVFQYDIYGGCGYISPQNILHEELTNFSGRGTRRKLDANQLIREITDGYSEAVKNAPVLRELALKRYSIDKLVKDQLKYINSKDMPHPKLEGDALLFANAAFAAVDYMLHRHA